MRYKLIDPKSYPISGIVLLLSWILFTWETGEFLDTFFAALLAAFLFWISYSLVRLVFLALNR